MGSEGEENETSGIRAGKEKPGVYTKRENSAVAASKEFILALHYGLRAMGAMTLRQKKRTIRK